MQSLLRPHLHAIQTAMFAFCVRFANNFKYFTIKMNELRMGKNRVNVMLMLQNASWAAGLYIVANTVECFNSPWLQNHQFFITFRMPKQSKNRALKIIIDATFEAALQRIQPKPFTLENVSRNLDLIFIYHMHRANNVFIKFIKIYSFNHHHHANHVNTQILFNFNKCCETNGAMGNFWYLRLRL